MKGAFWAFLLLGTMMASSALAQTNCAPTIKYKKTTYKYDLTSLYHSPYTYDSLSISSEKTYNTYTMNICGEASSSCGSTKAASVCGFSSNLGIMNMGLTETQEFAPIKDSGVAPGQGVTVKYSNGDICPSTGKARKSDVQVRCSTTTTSPYVYAVDEESDSACEVTFYIYGIAGCGSGGKNGMGAGGIILIILACLIVLYFALGAVYQWKFKEPQTFADYIIHKEFWFAIPGLVKDGVMFIAHGFKKDSYTAV